MKRTRGLRCAWLAFVLLHLALPSWSVIADARTLVPLPYNVIHIEAEGCAPSHPLDCSLCSFAGAAADPSVGLPELSLPGTAADAPLLSTTSCASVAAHGSPLPRGPPARS